MSYSGVSRVWKVGHVPLAPFESGPLRGFSEERFLTNIFEVISQKPCNTHRHEYLEKLLINNKCKTQF